jgi:peptide/nickel transport system ATP-binding protein
MNRPTLSIAGLTILLPRGADRPFAVEDFDLDLHPGKVTCLIGESGSGKSLVARSILGLLPDRVGIGGGSILFEGADLTRTTPAQMRAIRGAGIAMIFQEPMTALNPVQTIGRQITEVLRIHTALGRKARRSRAEALLESVHLPDPKSLMVAYPHQISGGQRQRAMIAMALALDPKLLIADEPTTALDVTTQAQILRLIAELQRRRGTAVLFITHDFGVVADIADDVAVLQKGLLVESGPAQTILTAPRHPYTQTLIAAVPKLQPPDAKPQNQDSPLVLQAVSLQKTYAAQSFFRGRAALALNNVSFELRRGETLGLVGESGSGKSTLARAVTRLLDVDAGEIRISGQDIAHFDRKRLRPHRRRIQMIFQDPYASLDPRQRIGDLIAEGPTIQGVPRAQARAQADDLLKLVGLDPNVAARFPHEFSGGQRQRIGIARALALQPDILVADEPVSALDVSVQAQVLTLLADIKARLHLSMLFVTHDLRVALQVCDRIAVMRQGVIVEIAPAQAIFMAPEHPYTRALFAAVPGAMWTGAGVSRDAGG